MFAVFGVILIVAHFGVPVAYFKYMKGQLNRSWNLRTDVNYAPMIVVIVPSYNEEELIIQRLDNLLAQTYPKDHLAIVVTDDASQDETRAKATNWIKSHPDVNAKIITATNHSGKMPMVRKVFEQIDETVAIVVLTDVDALWDPNALSNMVQYFADPTISVVTGCIKYEGKSPVENTYREFFNVLRVAESKVFSTPIHNGPFLALRMSSIRKYDLPDFRGVDDSSIASFFAFAGLRAIQVDDVKVWEPTRGNVFHRKTRRANRLVLNFLNTKKAAIKLGVYRKTDFEKIWKIEWWLHIVNPWLLIAGTLILVACIVLGQDTNFASIFLVAECLLLLFPPSRTWIVQQFYLIVGRIRNLVTHDIIWRR
ncbi:MAG TPA: glycosyltransferase [Candidatus Bathyarchaeia archaeon]|nr:glycosyltransferase [Candidatus Bathyarchaeia archaeon]